jgi:hypothetical protein
MLLVLRGWRIRFGLSRKGKEVWIEMYAMTTSSFYETMRPKD